MNLGNRMIVLASLLLTWTSPAAAAAIADGVAAVGGATQGNSATPLVACRQLLLYLEGGFGSLVAAAAGLGAIVAASTGAFSCSVELARRFDRDVYFAVVYRGVSCRMFEICGRRVLRFVKL